MKVEEGRRHINRVPEPSCCDFFIKTWYAASQTHLLLILMVFLFFLNAPRRPILAFPVATYCFGILVGICVFINSYLKVVRRDDLNNAWMCLAVLNVVLLFAVFFAFFFCQEGRVYFGPLLKYRGMVGTKPRWAYRNMARLDDLHPSPSRIMVGVSSKVDDAEEAWNMARLDDFQVRPSKMMLGLSSKVNSIKEARNKTHLDDFLPSRMMVGVSSKVDTTEEVRNLLFLFYILCHGTVSIFNLICLSYHAYLHYGGLRRK